MTEAEWLACTNPYWLLDQVHERASVRQVRLFSLARCRRQWDSLTDECCRRAVLVGERYAEGCAHPDEVQVARDDLKEAFRNSAGPIETRDRYAIELATCWCGLDDRGKQEISGQWPTFSVPTTEADADLFRDIFGNTFRPISLSSSWRTSAAVALAAQVYESRDFSALPILADALQDAGCDNADILGHCRSEGPHVRGCWVVDLVLSKE